MDLFLVKFDFLQWGLAGLMDKLSYDAKTRAAFASIDSHEKYRAVLGSTAAKQNLGWMGQLSESAREALKFVEAPVTNQT